MIQANRLFVAATMTRYAAEFYSADEINKLFSIGRRAPGRAHFHNVCDLLAVSVVHDEQFRWFRSLAKY
jgi:hypothetical protein